MAALDRGVPLVAMIKDHALRDEYARRLAGLVGVDEPNRMVARVRGLVRSGERTERARRPPRRPPAADGGCRPRVCMAEREVIKAALQLPDAVGKQFDELGRRLPGGGAPAAAGSDRGCRWRDRGAGRTGLAGGGGRAAAAGVARPGMR